MSLILSLETSSRVCSVAIHEDGKLSALCEIHQDQAHASKLAGLIEQTSASLGISLNRISAVAVSAGPGSYTGLRIGTSTAKGLCYALNVPLIAVGSLQVMALRVNQFNLDGHRICPMIDARRMEVYCCIINSLGNVIADVEAKIIDEHSFQLELEEGPIIFFGDGSDKCKAILNHRNAKFIDNVFAGASELGQLAGKKFEAGSFEDLESFEPFYLKEFRAKMPSNLISGTVNKIKS